MEKQFIVVQNQYQLHGVKYLVILQQTVIVYLKKSNGNIVHLVERLEYLQLYILTVEAMILMMLVGIKAIVVMFFMK